MSSSGYSMQIFLAPLSLMGAESGDCGPPRTVNLSSEEVVDVSQACGVGSSEWLSKSFQVPFFKARASSKTLIFSCSSLMVASLSAAADPAKYGGRAGVGRATGTFSQRQR